MLHVDCFLVGSWTFTFGWFDIWVQHHYENVESQREMKHQNCARRMKYGTFQSGKPECLNLNEPWLADAVVRQPRLARADGGYQFLCTPANLLQVFLETF
jgi:hypothetical protein